MKWRERRKAERVATGRISSHYMELDSTGYSTSHKLVSKYLLIGNDRLKNIPFYSYSTDGIY